MGPYDSSLDALADVFRCSCWSSIHRFALNQWTVESALGTAKFAAADPLFSAPSPGFGLSLQNYGSATLAFLVGLQVAHLSWLVGVECIRFVICRTRGGRNRNSVPVVLAA